MDIPAAGTTQNDAIGDEEIRQSYNLVMQYAQIGNLEKIMKSI